VTALYRADAAILTWWGTAVECASAIARLERQAELAAEAATAAFRRLDLLSRSWNEIQPLDVVRDIARRLLRTHNLRAADALQLAAALQAAEQRPASLGFVCLDDRLTLAAEREGFRCTAA
jgi:predicted nucleic acid-binding protein